MNRRHGRRDAPRHPGRLASLRAAAGAATSLLLVAVLAACDGGASAEAGSTEGAGAATGEAAAAPSSASDGAESARAQPDTQEVDISDLGVNAGVPSAPIQVVEFSDFGCPHCRQFHMNAYPELYRDYVQTGHVIWKYIPVAMGMFPNSLEATRAGQCAIEQSDFTPVRDELFRNQLDWMNADDPVPLFMSYAEEAGLDVERFRTCLEEREVEEEVRQAVEVANRVGIDGTPTFFIQGQRVEGSRPAQFFRQVFDRMLERAESQGDGAGGS